MEVHLVHKKGPHVLAAADAYAQGQNVGIGGWWMLPGCAQRLSFGSALLLRPQRCRTGLCRSICRSDLQKYSVAVEALAQLVLSELLLADSRVCPPSSRVWQVVLRQSCDNSGVCDAVSQASSMRRPVADVLQAMATLCMQSQVVLQVSHTPRRIRTADWRRLLDAGQLR